ncbi:MAG: hypothetical protein ACRYG5_16920 [Janthinobacterium lividum]
MTELRRRARRAPLALFAVFGGTALIVCNPGYFWDDWVWIYQQPDESIRIGRELGIFWGGYLTNAINALRHPSLAMRATALAAWVIAGAAVAYVLYRQHKISSNDAFQLFLLYAATHVALIRFLTSLAMYNVYIACFWVGCAILMTSSNLRRARLMSLPLFFMSFYLNSLIALYLTLLIVLAARHLMKSIDGSTALPHWRALRELRTRYGALPEILRATRHRIWLSLRVFAVENALLIALPFVFVIVKRLTTVKSRLYGDYNSIDYRVLISAIFNSFGLIRPVLRDFFAIASRGVQPLVLLSCCVICFLLLRLVPRVKNRTTLRMSLMQAALGWVIFAAAVYPYILVGKVPDLRSFYESRNILPALPGFALVLISFTNILDCGFSHVVVLRKIGRDLVLAYVIGASVGSGYTTGLDLWRDWIRQTAIITFIRANEEPLKDVRTFVFDDTAHRIWDRTIWNYEYTGDLVTVYRTRERLGVSVDEYSKWPPNVPVVSNAVLRRRFNFGDYQFEKPHAIITVRNGVLALNDGRVLSTVYSYLRGEPWQHDLTRYVDVHMAYEFVEADQRVAEIFEIGKALAAYRHDHGHYPRTSPDPQHGNPMHEISSIPERFISTSEIMPAQRIGPPIARGYIPGLLPDYMPRMQAMTRRAEGEPIYLYASDGLDFKLVYANPPDLAYAKQTHPTLIDVTRPGYGTWTMGAKYW